MNLTQSQKFLRKFGLRIAKYYSTSTTYETFNTYEHFLFISKLISRTNGAFVECGFGTGKSFSALSHLAQRSEREIYGFDTFEGFPSVHENDIKDIKWEKGDFCNESYDRLTNIIDIHNNNHFNYPINKEIEKRIKK